MVGGNKNINSFTVIIWIFCCSFFAAMAPAFEGHPDLNLDGSVNMIDLCALAKRWLDSGCLQSNLCDGADLNFDDIVNFRDFALLVRNWLSVPLTRPPIVKNLAANQGVETDDHNVHVFYDLIDPDPYDRCTITLEFSNNGGLGWDTIGTEDMVEPAIALHNEFNPVQQDANNCKVRITATDVYGKTAQAVSETFRILEEGNADKPNIGYVTAKQRNDASKLVDIYYKLTPDISNYRYYVYVQISKDGGGEFVTVAGVTGDVGASQQPDSADIKHIVWNPTVDWPGENIPNCMAKVLAHGFFQMCSDKFSIDAAGLGSLAGALYDANTGGAIDSAQVMVFAANDVQQQPMFCYTDSDGLFSFENLPAGEKIIILTKCISFPPTPESACYRPIWKTATVGESSTTFLNIMMAQIISGGGGGGGSKPVVVDVHGKYCSADKHAYYLHGFPLQESFEATIDWNGGGSTKEVHWITPKHTYTQPCSGGSVTRTFDMGQDIGIDDINENGYLKVVAVRDDNSSQAYWVNLNVIEPPPILDLLSGYVADLLYIPVATGEGFEYRILGLPGAPLSLGNSSDISIPIFNGAMEVGMKTPEKSKEEEKKEVKRKKLGNFKASFTGMVSSDGKAEMATLGWDKTYKKEVRKKVKGKKKKGVKVGTIKATPNALVGLDFYWANACNKWRLGGTFDLGCKFMYETPPPPKVVAVVMGVPVYVRGELSLDLNLGIGLIGYDEIDGEPLWSGAFDFEPLGKGFLGAGVAKVACVEGYLGGGFHSQIVFIPCVKWQGTYIILIGGVQVVVGPFSVSVPRRYEWHPDSSGAGSCSTAMTPMDIEILSSQSADFEPLPRDYLSRDPADLKGIINLPGGMEQPIDPNGTVYPFSTPDVAAIGDDMLAVWINDNTNRKMSNRTELMYATYDSRINSWTASEPVEPNSNTADMNPQLISLSDGNAACIWQDAEEAVNEGAGLDTLLGKMEIVASIYNGKSWSDPLPLSFNTWLDRSPRIAGENVDNLMAVWITNEQNDTWGNKVNAKNTIMYSKFNGSAWDYPAGQIVPNIGKILDTTLAYNGSTATYVYCLDTETNPDPCDSNDHELYMLRYTDAWEQTQLTNDNIADAAPKLVYADDRLLLFWLRGNDIYMAEGPDFDNRTVIRSPGESMGSKDFDVFAGEDGQIALIWSDMSQPKNEPNNIHDVRYDIWACYYEPSLKLWSLPRQLTWDDAAERFVSGAFGSYRDLFCVYDKTQTRYVNDPNFLIAGQPVVKPKRNRSDLYSMSYRMGVDLSVVVEDLEIRPTNPLPQTETKVSAVVKNLGEYPATDVEVRFSWSDFYENPLPEEPNILDINNISTVIIGTLAGGEQVEVIPHEPWNVPVIRVLEIPPIPPLQWRKLSVEVSSDQDDKDQNDDEQDRDANDNSATCQIMRPDLTISEMSVQTAGPNSIITARVANEGALKAYNNIKVLLRRDDPNDGSDLDQTYITEGLEAGAYYDVSFTVPSEGMMAYAIVDPNKEKDEFNEDNNVRPIRISGYSPNEPPVMVYIYASDPVAKEGQPGTEGNGKFIVHRVGQTESNLTVHYNIGGNAINGDDYKWLDSVITIPNDVNWMPITVEPKDNSVPEDANSVIITLESVEPNENCEIGSFLPATVVIQDDEPPVPVYICASEPFAQESNSTVVNGEFIIYCIGGTDRDLTVSYDINETAINGNDHEWIDSSVTIDSGDSSAIIQVIPKHDTAVEGIESVTIKLTAQANDYTIDSPNEATVFINDDDYIQPVVSIKATDSTAMEKEAGFPEDDGEFTVSRAVATNSSLTVNYTISGTATNDEDYDLLSGSVEIQPWSLSQTFPVSPIDDVNSEDDETVVVEISPSVNYDISPARQATVVIEDNDRIDPPVVEVNASVSTVYENDSNQGQFTIECEGRVGTEPFIVHYTTSGTARCIDDYVEDLNGFVYIPSESNSAVITITPINDENIEEHELVIITLDPCDLYKIGHRDMAVVAIEDDDWYDDWVRISYDSFESGWGSYYSYADADVSIHCGMYAADGNCAANIQGNAELGSAFFYKTAVDVNAYSQIEIVFDFIAVDLADGEGFWVEYYDGNQWQAVASYTQGYDFVNGTFYYDQTININDTDYTFPANMKIRFTCDASSDTDDIYIDRIRVSGKAE